jgi:tetratricopeptide (TPR) repeat protein
MRAWLFAFILAALGANALAQQQTSTLPSTSRSTFLKLTEVQELWEKEDYATAIRELEALAAEVRDNDYEYALTNQYLANTSILAGDPERAKQAIEVALSTRDIPPPMKADLDLFYGQLLIGDEEYERALKHLEDWLAYPAALDPLPRQIFYVAYANYMTGNLPRAQTLIERAMEEARQPNDQWERVYYQILMDQGKYARALEVIMAMLNRQPGEDGYWRLLVNHYMQREDNRKALAALVIADLQNPMTSAADRQRLVSLYGYVEIPEKAARLLERYLADESLPRDAETLSRLADLWTMARERDKAKAVLLEAAEVAPDGRTYRRLGGIYFEEEQWRDAYAAYLEALDQGGLKEPAQVQMLAGVSAYRAGMTREARVALEAAAEYEEYRAQAEALLRRL